MLDQLQTIKSLQIKGLQAQQNILQRQANGY